MATSATEDSGSQPHIGVSESGPGLYPIACDEDVAQFRRRVREAAVAAGLRLIDQTRLVTAAGELARNALEHGGGGLGEVCAPEAAGRRGVRLIVEDGGPGIADVEQAMTDDTSGARGLGMGLPGARRLVDAFELWSQVGVGTCVTIEKWVP
jgi:serine/threonine-protein kinase RsbT